MRLETEPGVHAREYTYVFACVYMCTYVQLSQCLVNIGLRRGQIPKQSSHMKSYINSKAGDVPTYSRGAYMLQSEQACGECLCHIRRYFCDHPHTGKWSDL